MYSHINLLSSITARLVASEDVSLDSPEEKEELDKKNEEAKGMFDIMKEALTDVKNIII